MTKTKYIVAAISLIIAVAFGGLMLAKEYNQRNKVDCIQSTTPSGGITEKTC